MKDKMDTNKKKLATIFIANIENNSEKFEIPGDTLISWTNAHKETMKASLGKMEARNKAIVK
jgi:hypothetical protein